MAEYGIVGDDYGTNIPVTEVDPTQLLEEQKAARYSKSKEFKKLKEHLESRVEFYQKYLPDGRPLSAVNREEREDMWLAANVIIGELNGILTYYEDARTSIETVE